MDYVSQMYVGPSWSKLPLDLMQLVFERLGYTDFQRAKSVCSSWHYASKKSSPNNQIPWLILFPKKGNDYCLLFNPEEQDKLHTIQDLGVNFANSHCLATCGSWLLMQDLMYNLYIVNIFTRETIDLPSMKSVKSEQNKGDMFLVTFHDSRNVLFWIDEKTKDYVVIWIIQYQNKVVYSRKGDKFWNQIEHFDYTIDMVYKDKKLYLYTISRDVKILDFSQDVASKIFETQVNDDVMEKVMDFVIVNEWKIKTEHLVVSVTGQVLRVKCIVWNNSDVWTFRIYKMDSSNSKWEKLDSLGDESILLDLGITIVANNIKGINRNSIYFSGNHCYYDSRLERVWREEDLLIFSIGKQEVERPHRNISSSIQLSNARWFVPNFKQI